MTSYTPPGHHKTFAAFRDHLRAVGPSFDADEDVLGGPDGALAQPFEASGLAIGNRFAMHPMEGWDGTREGLPTAHTLRRWRRFGQSGAKLIWGGEAFAVQSDGRANPNQLYLNDDVDVLGGLRALLAEVREGHAEAGFDRDGLVVGLQLTHSGRWSRPDGPPVPRTVQRHPILDRRQGITDDAALLTDDELAALVPRYVRAAELAAAAGFDFVDVKACHGYLLHEVLAGRARGGAYGGSFENRTRLFVEIVEGIRAACPGLPIGCRVSLADIHPHRPNAETRIGEPDRDDPNARYELGFGADATDPTAFDLEEPLRFLGLCQGLRIELINQTLCSPYWCPHLQRPASYPPSDGYLPPEDPLRSVLRHLEVVRTAKHLLPDLRFVGTGYTYLQEWLPHLAQAEVRQGHVDSVGLGRMALIYPDLVRDVLAGRPLDRRRICRTFSDCTTAPRNGMLSGCFPLDPYYKAMPEAQRLKELKRSAGNR